MNGFIIAIISLTAISGGIHLANHGKPRKDKYNFFMWMFSVIVTYTLYYYAGLFD